MIRSETITNGETAVHHGSHCSVARCLRDIGGIAQLNINGSVEANADDGAQVTEFD